MPFFFKQWGEWAPDLINSAPFVAMNYDVASLDPTRPIDRHIWLHANGYPQDGPAALMERVGKHAAGRLLDGQEWSQLPE